MRAVLERDFLFEAAKPRAVMARTLVAALVAATVCLSLWIGTERGAVPEDEIGFVVFVAGGIALLILLALLTPPLVVGSILEERRNDTLILVLATPISPRSFAGAKLLSRWGISLLVAFSALPALAMGTLFGGVSGQQLLGLVVTAMALSLEMAAWSVWISSASRRLATAVILSFVLPIARWTLTMVFIAWVEESDRTYGGFVEFALALMTASTPLGPASELVGEGIAAKMGLYTFGSPILDFLVTRPWWAYLAFAASVAGAAVAAAGARLEREAEPRDALLGRTKAGRRWFRGKPPAGNPVVWKEVRLLNTAASRPLFYGVLGLLLLILALWLPSLGREREAGPITALMLTLVSLVAVVQGASALGQERSQGGYDLLRATLLTPRQIVLGKLAGVFTGLGLLATVPVCAGILGVISDSFESTALVSILLLTLLVPGGWALVGMRIGVSAPTPRSAVVRAVSLFAGLLLGCPILAGILALVGINEDEIILGLVAASPPVAIFGVMDDFFGSDIGKACLLWIIGWALLGLVTLVLLPRTLARSLDRERGPGPGTD